MLCCMCHAINISKIFKDLTFTELNLIVPIRFQAITDQRGRQQDKRVHPQMIIEIGGSRGIPEKIVRMMMNKLPAIKTTILE